MRYLLISLFIVLSACQPKKAIIEEGAEIQQWRMDNQIFSLNKSLSEMSDGWEYQAKIGLKTIKGNEQANLIWQQLKNSSNLRLFGPLGMGTVKLSFDQHSAQLIDNKGNFHSGQSATALLSDIAGWPLPIDALTQWLFLVPDSNYVFQYRLNGNGQLASIRQLGWQVDYQDYRNYGDHLLPRKITAHKQFSNADLGEITVKLITKSWLLGIESFD